MTHCKAIIAALLVAAFAFANQAGAVVVPLEAYNATAPGLDLSVDVTVDGGVASFAFSNDSTGDSAGAVAARIYFATGLGAVLSNPGDSLLVTFDYAGSLDDLVAAITDQSGNSRIAAHVLDCVNGNSCSAMTSPVPAPAAFPALLSALGLLIARRRRAA